MSISTEIRPGLPVVVRPRPLSIDTLRIELAAGLTIAEIVKVTLPGDADVGMLFVRLGDDPEPIARVMWHRVKPKPGVLVRLDVMPAGGGGMLRTVLQVAIIAAAITAAALVPGVGGALLAAGISMGGTLALNALVPPTMPKAPRSETVDQSVSSSASGNQDLRWRPLIKVLGFHRLALPLAAQPIVEIAGGSNDQYVRALYTAGPGKVTITDIEIGNTPIEKFGDVEHEVQGGVPGVVTTSEIYPARYAQEQIGQQLKSGVWEERNTPPDTRRAQVIISYPTGLLKIGRTTGDRIGVGVVHRFEYRPAAGGAWGLIDEFTINRKTGSVVYDTKGVTFPSAGEWSIRIKRLTEDHDEGDRTQSESWWSSLISIEYGNPVTETGQSLVALRAQGQINTVTGLVKRVCLDWDAATEDWIERATNNPASLIRFVLQDEEDNADPVPDDQIDIDRLAEFHEHCVAKGFTFNYVVENAISVEEMVQMIATAGGARIIRPNGRWSVAIDRPQSVPVQLFSPRNTTSLRWEKVQTIHPHALRVRFKNEREKYEDDMRVVYYDGYSKANASKFEDFAIPGVTNPDQIYVLARRRIAEAKLRPIRYQIGADWEAMRLLPGDPIRYMNDTILLGTKAGRIKQIVTDSSGRVTTIGIDEEVLCEVGKTYVLRHRSKTIVISLYELAPVSGVTSSFDLATPIAASQIEIGDLVAIGEIGKETVELVVLEPPRAVDSDLNYEVVAVPAAPAIFTSDTEAIPEFESGITLPTGFLSPAILRLRSDEYVLIRAGDGALLPRILVSIGRASEITARRVAQIKIEWQRTGGTDATWSHMLLPADAGEASIETVETGESYDIRAAYIYADGSSSPYTGPFSHVVVGVTTPPPDVTIAWVEGNDLAWDYEDLPDLKGFAIRWTPGSGGVWEAGQSAHGGLVTERRLSLSGIPRTGSRTIMIKAIDRADNESLNAYRIETDQAFDAPGERFAVWSAKDAGWIGFLVDGEITGEGILESKSNAGLFDPPSAGLFEPADGDLFEAAYSEMTYRTTYVVSEDARPSDFLAIEVDAEAGTAWSVSYSTSAWTLTEGFWDQGGVWDADDQWDDLTVTGGLPMPLILSISAESSIVFRLRARGVIQDFRIIHYAPTLTERQTGVAIASGGTFIPLARSFRQITGVLPVIVGTGDAVTARVLEQSTAGVTIECRDALGLSVTGTVNLQVTGI